MIFYFFIISFYYLRVKQWKNYFNNQIVYRFEPPIACGPTPLHSSRLVVEHIPIRDFVADCPIPIFFKPSHLPVFHGYVVVYKALRGSQH